RWITRWRHLTGDAIEYEPYQQAAEKFPQVPREDFGRAVHLFEPDGRVSNGAEAVFRSLALAGQKRYLFWAYEKLPPFDRITEFAYGVIAGNRDLVDRFDLLIVGKETRPTTFVRTQNLFLR